MKLEEILVVTFILNILKIVTIFGLPSAVTQTAYEFCYSKNDEEGRCVSFDECQPYRKILSERPILKSHLRLVVNLTCTFDIEEPLICCPLQDIVMNPNALGQRKSNLQSNPDQEFSTDTQASVKPHSNFYLLPSLTDCSQTGASGHKFGSGNKISRGDFPFLGLLGYQNPESGVIEFSCGASIINKRYMLTSAKCANGGLKPFVVRLGDYDLVNNPDCSNIAGKGRLECSYTKDVIIDQIISHPQYNLTDFSYFQPHDIALIRLSQDIIFNDFIQPVCLPFISEYKLGNYPKNLERGALTLSAGWGKYSGNQGSTVMRQVPQPIKSNEKCAVFYSRQQLQCEMSNNQLCAGGACGADMGGPLLILLDQKFVPSKLFQVGVTSFGPQYCTHGVPSVHTKVTFYLDWILDSMEP